MQLSSTLRYRGARAGSVERECALSPSRDRAVTEDESKNQLPYDLPEQYQVAAVADSQAGRQRPARPRSKRTRSERAARIAESRASSAAETRGVSRRSILRVGALAGSAGLVSAGIWKLSQGDPFGAQHASAGAGTTSPSSTTTTSTPTTTAPAVTDVYARWVQDENALPGTADWNIGDLGDQHAIEGFFDTTSAANGDTVRLFASTTASTFHVEAYRMGWYQGLGGRLVWSSPETPGRVQPPPTVDSQTNMIDTAWQQPLPIDITDD
jgi:hypothetical protein